MDEDIELYVPVDLRIVSVGKGRYRVWLRFGDRQLWDGEETDGTKALAVAMSVMDANPVEALGWAALRALDPREL